MKAVLCCDDDIIRTRPEKSSFIKFPAFWLDVDDVISSEWQHTGIVADNSFDLVKNKLKI